MFDVEGTHYTVEELVAQILKFAMDLASKTAEQEVKTAVVTVPVYFTQAQRKSLLLAIKIAGIKLLQLLNTPTAVAINYGVFRQSTFNETARNIMFYDMGATSTVATIVQYKTVKESKKSKNMVPSLEILGIGYDRTLGGVEFDYRLRDHLMEKFLEKKGVNKKAGTDPRALSKLFTNAQKVKKVLSANKETQSQVEGLYDEIDFKQKISREEFETMCADLFDRVSAPIEAALKMTKDKLTAKDIDEIIIFGGGVRIPKVQSILKKTMDVEVLGMSINADEAAALGAAYRGAELSKTFRLKPFVVKDASLFPVVLSYDKPVSNATDAKTKPSKVKLFSQLNLVPQNKKFKFSTNITGDFTFTLSYGDISFLPEDERSRFHPSMISKHSLKEVAKALDGHEGDKAQGISVRCEMDLSGIISVEKAYAE